MTGKSLLIENRDRICTITIDRPEKRNALSRSLLLELANVLGRLQEEDSVRCLVIRGSGEKAFCAGHDISDLPIGTSPEVSEAVKADTPLDIGMRAVSDFPFPVIAMINGLAFGGGCELAISCDIRIAADDASFSMPPAKLGVVYRWNGLLKFIEIVGQAHSREMFFTGRTYQAAQAKEMGLIHHALPRAELAAFVYGMAQDIADNAPLALKGIKAALNRLRNVRRIGAEDIQELEELRYQAYRSEDIKEGRAAFRERRKPLFKGR
jgi:enoyl-CoA hydratase/carnithine racemase